MNTIYPGRFDAEQMVRVVARREFGHIRIFPANRAAELFSDLLDMRARKPKPDPSKPPPAKTLTIDSLTLARELGFDVHIDVESIASSSMTTSEVLREIFGSTSR